MSSPFRGPRRHRPNAYFRPPGGYRPAGYYRPPGYYPPSGYIVGPTQYVVERPTVYTYDSDPDSSDPDYYDD